MSKRQSFAGCLRPSLAEGMGRILDFGNTLSRINHLGRAVRYRSAVTDSRSPAARDRAAIAADWRVAGHDIRAAVKTTVRGHARSKLVNAGQRTVSEGNGGGEVVGSGVRKR